MRKRMIRVFAAVLMLGLSFPCAGTSETLSDTEIVEELKILKARINQLEAQLKSRSNEKTGAVGPGLEGDNGEKGLSDGVRPVEGITQGPGLLERWSDKITLSGLIEAEIGYEDMDYQDSALQDTHTGDITLSTAQLGIDAEISNHVQAHLLFLWEENETEPVDLDEGFILFDGKDVLPLYLNVGKMYVPFGNYESHFVSDPLTLELGETNRTALETGFVHDWIGIRAAVFNGDIDETNDNDDHIDNFVGSVMLNLPQGTSPDLSLTGGISYISNIAESDGLGGETPGILKDQVEGLGAFLNASFKERFFFEGEYIGALDAFQAGELSFDGGRAAEPKAWNFELAFAATRALELAAKYEGGDELGDFLPEKQYGGAATYVLFENTTLSLEFLRGEFENGDKRSLLTGQVAVGF